MCDATFALGQCGAHFLQCPSRRDYTRLPKRLQNFLNSRDISQIHHVTLGFGDSFLLTYQDRHGKNRIESQNLPDELNDFLYATNEQNNLVRLIPQIRLTLGPYNESFFVGDGSTYLWMNLPTRLLTALQSRIQNGAWLDKPRLIALGADQNYLLITTNNAAIWDLSHYRTLSRMIEYSRSQFHGIEEVHNITLHCYRYQGFVALSRNGTLVFENLPQWSMDAFESIKAPIEKDTHAAEVRRKHVNLQRRTSASERSALSEQPPLRREWSERQEMLRRDTRGLKLSLSLSLSLSLTAGGIGKMLG